ncbi:MAG: DUF1800 domain-containing protein [Pseudomonadota bacterium]
MKSHGLFSSLTRKLSYLSVIAATTLLMACNSNEQESDNFNADPEISSGDSPSQNTIADFPTDIGAAQFLNQATFGARSVDIQELTEIGFSEWIRQEFNKPLSEFIPIVLARGAAEGDFNRRMASDAVWEAMVEGDDQLRLRTVFALSQILVVSDSNSALSNKPRSIAFYADVLSRNAFGNYRTLLEDVTYTPAMAEYLTYYRNRKGDPTSGRVPDENYARELLQLFTIGLVELGRDGLPLVNAAETYGTQDVEGLSRVFTGLSHKGDTFFGGRADDWEYSPIEIYADFHSTLPKSFLGLTIPAGTPGSDSIELALDHIFAHPNVGPFIARQLIQRFVTSNPTGPFVERVVTAFETGQQQLPDGTFIGSGNRGDLRATISAILLDPEARQDPSAASNTFGKVREPVLRFTQWARAFNVQSARAQDVSFLKDAVRTDRLAQQPFRSPSVFNFYRPGYVAPGSLSGDAGLVAPELQITNETTVIGYINTMSRFVRDQMGRVSGADGTAFNPVYTDELKLAEDPDALVDHLDRLLTYGRMSSETRTRIIRAINEIPIREDKEDEDIEDRVHLAVLMAVTSPAYIVQQ